MKEIFEAGRDLPPVSKNQPPVAGPLTLKPKAIGHKFLVLRPSEEKKESEGETSGNVPSCAGAIAWMRSLYHRIKKPVLRFQTMEGLLSSEKGKEVLFSSLLLFRHFRFFSSLLFSSSSPISVFDVCIVVAVV